VDGQLVEPQSLPVKDEQGPKEHRQVGIKALGPRLSEKIKASLGRKKPPLLVNQNIGLTLLPIWVAPFCTKFNLK
jgi:hypothetical protein